MNAIDIVQLIRTNANMAKIMAEIASLQSSHNSGWRGAGRKSATEYCQDQQVLEAVVKFFEGVSKQ